MSADVVRLLNPYIGSKDAWVISEGPVKPLTLISSAPLDNQFAVLEGELPSRVADNLFWMGRNAERCEICVRLLRSVFQTLQNEDVIDKGSDIDESVTPAMSAILRALSQATGTIPGFYGQGGTKRAQEPQRELISILHDGSHFGTLPFALNNLHNSAASVRDRISVSYTHLTLPTTPYV